MKVVFCGLLYLEENIHNAVNLQMRKSIDFNNVYLSNALLLAESLQAQQQEFILFTNNRSILLELLGDKNKSIQIRIQEISFITSVPEDTKFHAAHMRIDLMKSLGSANYDYIICLDLDTVAINSFSTSLQFMIDRGIPGCYDLTDQLVFEYGRGRIMHDMRMILGHGSEGRWYGGELICGPPAYFSDMYDVIIKPFRKYMQNLSKVCHPGFEMFYSAAVEELRSRYPIFDTGKSAIIGRYWSVASPYHPPPLDYYHDHFLLHLPADKVFLANWWAAGFWQGETFWNSYSAYAKKRYILSNIKKLILR